MQKNIKIEGINTPIIFARRKGTRNLKLSIKNDGKIRLTAPYGVPEFVAKQFASKKIDWINKHQKPIDLIEDGAHIGKNHRLIIKYGISDRSNSRVDDTEIKVYLPANVSLDSEKGQNIIKKVCEKALQIEAEKLLPQRLEYIANQKSIKYKTCKVKRLKSRWGSCDSYRNISLNTYLIQLDWHLIDYVICHELAHTVYQNHQKDFWNLVQKLYPDHKKARKELKAKPTSLFATKF